MENNNTNQTNPQQPSKPSNPVIKKMDVNLYVNQIKERYAKLPKNIQMMVIIASILFALMIILVLLAALFGKRSMQITSTPSPAPLSVSPTPQVILNASRYATDSGVLKIEGDLNNIEKQLESTDVKQTDLSLPNLDFNITFNQ